VSLSRVAVGFAFGRRKPWDLASVIEMAANLLEPLKKRLTADPHRPIRGYRHAPCELQATTLGCATARWR
jgi:hypothetical protein